MGTAWRSWQLEQWVRILRLQGSFCYHSSSLLSRYNVNPFLFHCSKVNPTLILIVENVVSEYVVNLSCSKKKMFDEKKCVTVLTMLVRWYLTEYVYDSWFSFYHATKEITPSTVECAAAMGNFRRIFYRQLLWNVYFKQIKEISVDESAKHFRL